MQALLAGCSLCRAHGRLFSQDFCSLVSRLQPRTPVFAAMSCSHHCLSSDTPQFFMALALHQGGPKNSQGSLKDISDLPVSAVWGSGEDQRPCSKPSSAVFTLRRIQKLPTAELIHCRLCVRTLKPFPPGQKGVNVCLSHSTSAMAPGQAFHRGAGDLSVFIVDLLHLTLKSPVSWCCPTILSRILFLMSCVASVTSPSGCLLIFYF